MITAKFKVLNKVHQDYGDGTDGAVITLIPDYAEGRNKEWSKWTPSGTMTINVKNPVAEQFSIGDPFVIVMYPEGEFREGVVHLTPSLAEEYHGQ